MEKLEKLADSESTSSDVSEHSITSSKSANQTLKAQNLQQQDHQPPLNILPRKSSKSEVTEKDSECSQRAQEETQKKEQKQEELNSEHRFVRDSLKLIGSIIREVEMLRPQVENFSGCSTDDRDYVYLEEMMIRAMVALDNVETKGNLLLRQERKRAIQYVQKLMRILDSSLKENKRHINYYRCNSDSDDDV